MKMMPIIYQCDQCNYFGEASGQCLHPKLFPLDFYPEVGSIPKCCPLEDAPDIAALEAKIKRMKALLHECKCELETYYTSHGRKKYNDILNEIKAEIEGGE